MFTQNRGATATYRALARGGGRGWGQVYQASQEIHAGRRTPPRELGRLPRLSTPGETGDAPGASAKRCFDVKS
jgi:hypothetical protein